MERPFLQSALREMQLILGSPRFWATFAAVVLIFWITGPYGTSEKLALAPRLGFWLVTHAAAWSIAIVFVVAADVRLRHRIAPAFARMMTGAVAAAPLIGIATTLIATATFGTPIAAAGLAENVVSGLFLSALFCSLTWMTMSAEPESATTNNDPPSTVPFAIEPAESARAVAVALEPSPILLRPKPECRGPLLHLTVEDHYTEVTTLRGRELVLLRFSDALKETGDTPGLQVHRSHWVADTHVDRLTRNNGKVILILRNGRTIPVSRTYAEAARARFE